MPSQITQQNRNQNGEHKSLLPIKAHYFFFFAALGPLLPQLNVFGKQLGISADIMGMVTSILPILWALAKPLFGFLVDYFQKQRKIIFIALVLTMSGSYCLLYFLPNPPESVIPRIVDIDRQTIEQSAQPWINIRPLWGLCEEKVCPDELNFISLSCGWTCGNYTKSINSSDNLSEISSEWTLYVEESNNDMLHQFANLYYKNVKNTIFGCDYFYMDSYDNTSTSLEENSSQTMCVYKNDCTTFSCALLQNMNFTNIVIDNTTNRQSSIESKQNEYFLYGTITFWGFVIFMCIGTVAFNVVNCISDAICFDVLGNKRNMKYGYQRAWGTIGYGLTAFVAGWTVDLASAGSSVKNFTPAFVLTVLFTVIDLYFCRKLELPKMSRPEGAGNTLSILLSRPSVLVFLFFAIIAGMFDSFIIYYMFWFLEDLAKHTGHMDNIKLLEGLTVAAESFGGELVFFLISGKILKKFGFGITLTFCLACYGIRFFAISVITNPWQILIIELIMQGPTYALTYSTIVGYAAAVAPPGLSATLQGIVAGMDDGFGFAVGSLLGGQLYKRLGGRASFQIFGAIAFMAAIGHAILVATLFKNYTGTPGNDTQNDKGSADSPEIDNLVDKTLTGKIVSFTALERDENNLRENNEKLLSASSGGQEL